MIASYIGNGIVIGTGSNFDFQMLSQYKSIFLLISKLSITRYESTCLYCVYYSLACYLTTSAVLFVLFINHSHTWNILKKATSFAHNPALEILICILSSHISIQEISSQFIWCKKNQPNKPLIVLYQTQDHELCHWYSFTFQKKWAKPQKVIDSMKQDIFFKI